MNQRTNVIYVNTDCNLRCEYCYEKASREGLPDQVNLTKDQIDEFLEEIVEREKGVQASTVVIMGGEPTLKMDLVEYIVNRSKAMDHNFAISMTTNGVIIKPYIKMFKEWTKGLFSLEISYDASGQNRRVFPNGVSSKKVVELSIVKLIEENVPFRISYTLHTGNYDNFLKDVIYIMEKYGKHISELYIRVARQELEDRFGYGNDIMEKFQKYLDAIYKRYNIPICDWVCNDCKKCRMENFIGNTYMSPTKGILYTEKDTEEVFDHFGEK